MLTILTAGKLLSSYSRSRTPFDEDWIFSVAKLKTTPQAQRAYCARRKYKGIVARCAQSWLLTIVFCAAIVANAGTALSESKGSRIEIGSGDVALPLAVVRGTPYEMGRQFGQLFRDEIQTFVPAASRAIEVELKKPQSELCEVWARSAAFGDDRVEQELAGVADGSGVSLAMLQTVHAAPLLLPYSCSSIAAWGTATGDGHLYHTRNLDWTLALKAQNFPAIVVYMPDTGIPHVVPTFAGIVGAHTGMNAAGVSLAEMGDSPAHEMPYDVDAPHFTVYFRTMLYDADSMTRCLSIFEKQRQTKRYHFVFAEGREERRAVKVRVKPADGGESITSVWKDADPSDEFAPKVLPGIVYNDEGRGAFPFLERERGQLNGQKLVELANRIPIKGDNVVNVVYDATDLKMWVSYARDDSEAYQRPYVFIDLKTLDADGDGKPDFVAPKRD
jgi:hypothetical protein